MSERSEGAIECERLGRVYRSRTLTGRIQETIALRDLSFGVPKGRIFGLLGPNGAGKTTTIRILSTLLAPTTGTARIFGHDVVHQASKVRGLIGFSFGGDRGLYGRLTGRENLQYFAALHHLSPGEADRKAQQLLERVGLAEAWNTLVEQYSRGMKQRLHIARALLSDPSVIFMDEPTLGLDPMGAQELRQYIPVLAAQGKTILLTTHYMFEADSLCDTIAIINKGSLIAFGPPSEIKRHFSRIGIVEVTLLNTRPGLIQEISALDGVQRVESGLDGTLQKLIVHTRTGTDLKASIRSKVGQGNVERLVVRDPTLEEAYLSILRE